MAWKFSKKSVGMIIAASAWIASLLICIPLYQRLMGNRVRFVYLDKYGNDLGSSVYVPDFKVAMVRDGRQGDLLFVHFELGADPDNWSDYKHAPESMKATYLINGAWVEGCHIYNVSSAAIASLAEWRIT